MNIFRILFLNLVLILFPILIYLIYLSTNRSINKKLKHLYLSFSLITSFFLVIQCGISNSLILILILNTIIILSYIENKVILSNVFYLLILLIYLNTYNNMLFLILIPVLYFINYLIYKKFKFNNYIFIGILIFISSIIYILWIYFFNNIYFNLESLIILISYIFMVNITMLIYDTSKRILNINMTIKELEKEKQIRLSLFKITHEIKNPIAVCKGYLDMLNVNDTKQVSRFVPILKSEIDRLLNLLQDFLLINKSNLDLDIMDMNMLVEENIEKLKPLLDENNIKLNMNLIDDELYINGDYNRLSQVIINLIKNSIEAIESKGVITINSIIKNNKYFLTIEDNGIGMQKETLDKIKEPFFTTKKRGSGLGVSLIYEIIDSHDGKINYESKYGEGTKVTLVFPLYE